MKQLFKRLIPNTFRRIDDYLLRNYPTVWRTRIHIVLPLALLAFPVLFAAGYFLPKNTFLEPLVDPIEPIEITKGSYFLIPFVFAVIAVFYWGFIQSQYKFNEIKPLKIIVILLIYGTGLFLIFGLDMTGFRLGTIMQTSTLMPENDLKYAENNNYFLYGFFPHYSIKRGHEAEYFNNNNIFRELHEQEDTILKKRYDKKYRESLSNESGLMYSLNRAFMSRMSYHLYRSDRPNHLSDLPNISARQGLSSLSIKSYILKLSNETDLSYVSEVLNQLDEEHLSYVMDVSDMSYQSDLLDVSYVSYLSHQPGDQPTDLSYYERFVKDNDAYQIYYKTYIFPKVDTVRLSSYNLDFSFKEFEYKNLAFDMPQYFYPLEDGVRAVRHAQQYLNGMFVYHYLILILQYIPFILLLFFSISFLSQRNFLAALTVGSIVYFSSNYFHSVIKGSKIHLEVCSSYLMAGIAILSFIITYFSVFLNHENRITNFFLHLFIVAAIGTALIPVFIKNYDATRYGEDGIYYIKTWAFYLTAALCLIAPVLFSYLKGLPKSR